MWDKSLREEMLNAKSEGNEIPEYTHCRICGKKHDGDDVITLPPDESRPWGHAICVSCFQGLPKELLGEIKKYLENSISGKSNMKIRKLEEKREKTWNAYKFLWDKYQKALVACSNAEFDFEEISRLPMDNLNYISLGKQCGKLLNLREELRRIKRELKKAENKWMLVNE